MGPRERLIDIIKANSSSNMNEGACDRQAARIADALLKGHDSPIEFREQCANLLAMNGFLEENVANMTDEIERLRFVIKTLRFEAESS